VEWSAKDAILYMSLSKNFPIHINYVLYAIQLPMHQGDNGGGNCGSKNAFIGLKRQRLAKDSL